MSRQARVLLICDDRRGAPNTVLDHIDAFRRYSRHDIHTLNTRDMPRSIALDLDYFDVAVIHYSVVLSSLNYLSADFRDKLRRFRGLKVEFIQDDYRWIDRETAASRDIGINVLFTVAPEPAASQVYDERLPGVRRVLTLTGYVPENLVGRPIKPLGERTIDVGYRARDLPFWLGRLSREKVWIGQRFLERAPAYGLRCDIAWTEDQRIYGERWIEFVSSCRATLGCESGASIADFDGSVEQAVLTFMGAHPRATFEDVHEAVLRPYEGNVVMNIVSPRVFEAAALGTALVMFPGEYSGVVSPEKHYIVLEKDFSNMDDVVDKLRDDKLVSAMTARARHDLIESGRWGYRAFVDQFDQVVDADARTMRGRSIALRYRATQAERAMRVPPPTVRLARVASRLLHRDPSMRFSVEREGQLRKGLLAMRVGLADPDLRPLLRLGRRSGTSLDRLLREILELSLLRRAATGDLPGQSFVVGIEFDPERRALSFVSAAAADRVPERITTADSILEAVRRRELTVIEWDHRPLGGQVRLDRPSMVVGIGLDGLETFSVLTEIGRSRPSALERALTPLLSGALRSGTSPRVKA
ncbi:MAG: glycosyltransferase family 1 protein [Chloroflexi bacterium]|nr:MAG: glycosyltransferase family 1 protein [Chloroflexota bacterium]TME07138.1 MAG: glycosyltransferase family 1 protein [Chloroflexota bacterium]